MSYSVINVPTAECRHRPVGKDTRLVDRFRFWFIFPDYQNRWFSYTVGMVKCTKCGQVLRIPGAYCSIPTNLLYFACFALFTWWELPWLMGMLGTNLFLLAVCHVAVAVPVYFLFDRVVWFSVMHLCRWRSVAVPPEEQKAFIDRESRRFGMDRRFKCAIYFLAHVLICRLMEDELGRRASALLLADHFLLTILIFTGGLFKTPAHDS